MAHVNHSRSNQIIWHDGCPECDERAASLPDSISSLDDANRVKAWHFMRAWKWSGGQWTADADQPSNNDRKLYECLYAIGVMLERAGISPVELESRLVTAHDVNVLRSGMGGRLMTPALIGINITGIYVSEH
jgi:hypothetical protein